MDVMDQLAQANPGAFAPMPADGVNDAGSQVQQVGGVPLQAPPEPQAQPAPQHGLQASREPIRVGDPNAVPFQPEAVPEIPLNPQQAAPVPQQPVVQPNITTPPQGPPTTIPFEVYRQEREQYQTARDRAALLEQQLNAQLQWRQQVEQQALPRLQAFEQWAPQVQGIQAKLAEEAAQRQYHEARYNYATAAYAKGEQPDLATFDRNWQAEIAQRQMFQTVQSLSQSLPQMLDQKFSERDQQWQQVQQQQWMADKHASFNREWSALKQELPFLNDPSRKHLAATIEQQTRLAWANDPDKPVKGYVMPVIEEIRSLMAQQQAPLPTRQEVVSPASFPNVSVGGSGAPSAVPAQQGLYPPGSEKWGTQQRLNYLRQNGGLSRVAAAMGRT